MFRAYSRSYELGRLEFRSFSKCMGSYSLAEASFTVWGLVNWHLGYTNLILGPWSYIQISECPPNSVFIHTYSLPTTIVHIVSQSTPQIDYVQGYHILINIFFCFHGSYEIKLGPHKNASFQSKKSWFVTTNFTLKKGHSASKSWYKAR